ncbi:hypothetical protein [Mesorhizobium sp. CAU 1732]|uniref:hypothetical protein n=1 Tax=Mesorhizobium sp. CAU 1732 TaxID=3140358 RepID=UPI0032610EC2
MLWDLGAGWLLMAFVVVGIIAFILALALNAIMGPDGFGASGNAIIITVGFFLGVSLANNLGYSMRDLQLAITTGLAGAFACLSVLALLKAALTRL